MNTDLRKLNAHSPTEDGGKIAFEHIVLNNNGIVVGENGSSIVCFIFYKIIAVYQNSIRVDITGIIRQVYGPAESVDGVVPECVPGVYSSCSGTNLSDRAA